MSRTLTNNFGMLYAIETAIGVAGTIWRHIEPNAINTFGATISTTPRNPISKRRARIKGTVTDLDSAVEFDADLTRDSFKDFIQAFTFSSFTEIGTGTAAQSEYVPTDVATDGYTVTANGDLTVGDLVFARGFTNAENNGLKPVLAASTSVLIKVAGLVLEATPPANAIVEIAGVRGAVGDLEIDSSGDLISTLLDFTTLGLTAGQSIRIGGTLAANQFSEQTDNDTNYGFARVTVIATNKLTLDKKRATFITDDGATFLVDIFFGQFCRDVSVDHDDFLEQSHTFEGAYEDLASVGNPMYEYAKGNYCNTMQLNMPLSDKASVTFGFIGTDTDVPVAAGDRKSGASTAIAVAEDDAYNTSSDFGRLRITQYDETGLTTDFKDVTVTISNGVTAEKVLNVLGAKFMNYGAFEVDLETTLLFTDADVVNAIRENTVVMMDFALRNDDGGFLIDIPSMTLGNGAKEFTENESIKIAISGEAIEDDLFNTSLATSMFPFLPENA